MSYWRVILPKRFFGFRRLIVIVFGVLIVGIIVLGNTDRRALIQVQDDNSSSAQVVNSFCSEKATRLGLNQKVVSFSLFLKRGREELFTERYFPGMKENLHRIRIFYPGWVMRIYTNLANYNGVFEDLERLGSEPDVFICNVHDIHSPPGNLTKLHKMVWRFLPIIDPTVEIFIIRDLDSVIDERERAAVKEWEASDKIFHGMRDHPNHIRYIMGGLWGGKTKVINEEIKAYLTKMFKKRRWGTTDQDILRRTFVPYLLPLFMFHDSYHCRTLGPAHPYPTKRNNPTNFIGQVVFGRNPWYQTNRVAVCPKACRPVYGKNWTYC